MNFLLKRVVFPLKLQVNFRHVLAALDDFAAQTLALLCFQPILQHPGNHAASPPGFDSVLKLGDGVRGQGVGAFLLIHGNIPNPYSFYHLSYGDEENFPCREAQKSRILPYKQERATWLEFRGCRLSARLS